MLLKLWKHIGNDKIWVGVVLEHGKIKKVGSRPININIYMIVGITGDEIQ
jgi:hypothetical protein